MAREITVKSTGNLSTIKITDNSDEVVEELGKKLNQALEAIGGQAEAYAKEQCPVDTGRLRNSITFATTKKQSKPNQSGGADAKPEDYAQHGSPSEDTVYIGTNVEYAPEQEYYGRKAHFLRNSVTNHSDDFKRIVEAALKS